MAQINYLAVLVTAVVNILLGMLWYSPILFGNIWMKAIGKTKEELGGAVVGYVFTIITALITAVVLALFIGYAQADTILKGIQTGFWIWLGFVATTTLAGVLWEGQPLKVYLIYNGLQLVTFIVMGSILAVWR